MLISEWLSMRLQLREEATKLPFFAFWAAMDGSDQDSAKTSQGVGISVGLVIFRDAICTDRLEEHGLK